MTKQKNVRWKCPECGNHHSWYWGKYDVFPGEITMNCDNPKCEAQSKMMMTVDKKGNGTAVAYKEDKELEDKLRRATEKVMNSQTEIDPSRILKDNDFIWYMGEKYQKIEEPPTLYNKLETWIEYGNFSQSKDVLANEVLNMVREFIPEPVKNNFMSEYLLGYNEAIKKMEEKLK